MVQIYANEKLIVANFYCSIFVSTTLLILYRLINMKNILLFFLVCFFLFACTNTSDGPDVSNIKVEIPIERFDRSFFSLDTNNISSGLRKLQNDYPDFYPDFMNEILGVSGADTNQATTEVSKFFIKGYLPLYQILDKKYTDIDWLQKDLQHAFQYVRYYFPDHKTGKATLFIGPLDAPGVALTKSGVAIGLHQFGGKDFPAYQSMEVQQLFPAYISRRFEPQYIVANAMKAVVTDIYPDRNAGKGLIEQMIEKGKQWWLLDKFLPTTPDSIKTGFTKNQLDWCDKNEGMIWNSVITNEKDIYTKDPISLQNYIGEAPFTPSMPEASPGNIGQWIGWQIVKKFAENNSSMTVADLLKTEAKKIFEEAKYKPK
jgi:hypothetical protein